MSYPVHAEIIHPDAEALRVRADQGSDKVSLLTADESGKSVVFANLSADDASTYVAMLQAMIRHAKKSGKTAKNGPVVFTKRTRKSSKTDAD